MSLNLRLGHIYEVVRSDPDSFPVGTRVEFIGGFDDDVFTDGKHWDYLDSDDLRDCEPGAPIEYSQDMSIERCKAMTGEDPSFNFMK